MTGTMPKDSFVVAQAETDGRPSIWSVNRAMLELPREAFPWHLSIIAECVEVDAQGMPSKAEMATLEAFGEILRKNIEAKANAVFVARITCDGTRQFVFRVRDPEAANGYLSSAAEGPNPLRQFEYRMDNDPRWALANEHLRIAIAAERQLVRPL